MVGECNKLTNKIYVCMIRSFGRKRRAGERDQSRGEIRDHWLVSMFNTTVFFACMGDDFDNGLGKSLVCHVDDFWACIEQTRVGSVHNLNQSHPHICILGFPSLNPNFDSKPFTIVHPIYV